MATFSSVIGVHYKFYTCDVAITNSEEVIEDIDGTHEDEKLPDDIKSISISEATCYYFPKEVDLSILLENNLERRL